MKLFGRMFGRHHNPKRETHMIELGKIVRDRITGFEGVVVCRTEWLFLCVRIGVQSQALKDGQAQEPAYFDEAQLEVIGDSGYRPRYPVATAAEPAAARQPTGGPKRESPRERPGRAF